jgi:methylisocitrate lyase
MTEFGKSPNLDFATLAGMGYRMALYPVTTLRLALKATQHGLAELKQKGHQRDLLPEMLTRQELYDLLGYEVYEARDRAYFGNTSPDR